MGGRTRWLAILFLAIVITGCSTSSSGGLSHADMVAINGVLDQFAIFFLDADTAGIENLLASTVELTENGRTIETVPRSVVAQEIVNTRWNQPDLVNAEYANRNITGSTSNARVTAIWFLRYNDNSTQTIPHVLHLRKGGGNWQIFRMGN